MSTEYISFYFSEQIEANLYSPKKKFPYNLDKPELIQLLNDYQFESTRY